MKIKAFPVFLTVFLAFTLFPTAYAEFRLLLPEDYTLHVLDGYRAYMGNEDYIVSQGTDVHVTRWLSNDWTNYTVDSSGYQLIYTGSQPSNVYIDGTLKSQGDGWTYDNSVANITTATSSAALFYGSVDNPPTIVVIGYNSTVAGSICLFYCHATDDYELSHAIFETNTTGAPANDTITLSGTDDWANITKTLPASAGVVVTYQFWINDSAGQWTTQEPFFMTTASGNPTYSNLGYTTSIKDTDSTFHCRWTDSSGLGGYIFSTNLTGVWVNSTFTSLSGTTAWANETETLPQTVGVNVGYQWYCNDTNNLWSKTARHYLTVTERGAEALTFTPPTSLLQYLLNMDFVGFVAACYTTVIGQGFYALVLLGVFGVIYNRTKSLALCSILWLLIGGLLITVAPIVSPLAVILVALGLTGIIVQLFNGRR